MNSPASEQNKTGFIHVLPFEEKWGDQVQMNFPHGAVLLNISEALKVVENIMAGIRSSLPKWLRWNRVHRLQKTVTQIPVRRYQRKCINLNYRKRRFM
ncbi:hypothetical protein TNCV_4170181 [Trichonephila clavipes]|nr:hypothetical protein TNCV_4170181 [Trichonephila clavipes]